MKSLSDTILSIYSAITSLIETYKIDGNVVQLLLHWKNHQQIPGIAQSRKRPRGEEKDSSVPRKEYNCGDCGQPK